MWHATSDYTCNITQYFPSGLAWAEGLTTYAMPEKFNGKEFVEMHGFDTYDYGARGYYAAIGRFTTIDPLAEKDYSISPYAYCDNNPVNRIDPDGRDDVPAFSVTGNEFTVTGIAGKTAKEKSGRTWFLFFSSHGQGEEGGDWFSNSPESVSINKPFKGDDSGGTAGAFNDAFTFTENHFNGGLGTVGVSVQGYNKLPNNIKRAYAYKLSKMIGVKSGKIFQGAKGLANGTSKLVSKLGPVGNVLSAGIISYEVGTYTWDAHTIVNGALMVGAGVAAVFSAPAVLTGIAVYGVGDYFFDFGDSIDKNIGRNSGKW